VADVLITERLILRPVTTADQAVLLARPMTRYRRTAGSGGTSPGATFEGRG
jgi:hypothetical protein